MTHESLRVLYARDHTTIHAGVGVFLAGPTPPSGEMKQGWRRVIVERLRADPRLCPCMTVVLPEPEDGLWRSINVRTGAPDYDRAVNKQVQWEWQYLNACFITAFWMPTYWKKERSGPFPANIGCTTRWEFGYYFARWENDQEKHRFIVGAPVDAEKVGWPLKLARSRGLYWHELDVEDKPKLVAESFIEAIAQALIEKKWCGC